MARLSSDRGRLAATILFAVVLTGTLGLVHAPRPAQCDQLVVASSQEKAGLLVAFTRAYAAAHRSDGRCASVLVEPVSSGAAEQALESGWDRGLGPRPDVWSPASTTWEALLQQRSPSGAALLPAGQAPSLFLSPLVIAMPQPMAAALGYPAKPIGWGDILALARTPGGWAAIPGGNPAWGLFKLGKTDPNVSTSGLHALLSTYYAATGGKLTPASVDDPAAKDFVASIEPSVVHYGETAGTFLTNLNEVDNQGHGLEYVSAIAVEEQELINYNRGGYDARQIPPATALVPINPREGTAVADHPYITLRWSHRQKAASDFQAFISEPAQQAAILARGFRDNFNHLSKSVLAGDPNLRESPPDTVIQSNNGAVLARILAQWKQIRKHARVLILVDVAAQDTPSEGIGWAKEPMTRAVERFDAADKVGLWTFPAPGAPFAASAFGAPSGTIGSALLGLKTSASPADVDGVLGSAISAMGTDYDPSRIDAVLLITGSHAESQAADLRLERALRNQPVDRFVRVFIVAPPSVSGKAQERLRSLALAGRGDLYQTNRTQTLIDDVVSNF